MLTAQTTKETFKRQPKDEKKEKEQVKEEHYLHTFKLKHLWIKKATGLGITEFCLRFMAWLCLRNDDYKGSQRRSMKGSLPVFPNVVKMY
jgi:hypothetical protein